MKRVFILFIGFLLVGCGLANAKDKPKMMFPLGPVHSTNGMTLPKDSFVTSLKAIFLEKDEAYSGSDKVFDPKKRDMSVQRYNAIFRYGLGGGFDLRFLVPFFDKKMDMFNPKAKVGGSFGNSGMGDMRVFLRYQLTSQKQGDSFFSAIDFGAELPTGDSDSDFFFKNRKKLPNHKPYGMQLGDGSMDPILGISATKLMKSHRVDGSLMYFFNQEGDNDFKKGDALNYNLAYSYLAHPKFMPSLELNGKYTAKSEEKGKTLAQTGGHELFVTPGFSSFITKKLRFSIAYSIPVYRDMEKGALGTDSIITAKLAYKW